MDSWQATMNGFCISVGIKPVKLYIRFWKYNDGVDGLPDWCIILGYCRFTKKQDQELQGLMRFFKEYALRYGYRYIGIEDNPQFNRTLEFQCIQSVIYQAYFIVEIQKK